MRQKEPENTAKMTIAPEKEKPGQEAAAKNNAPAAPQAHHFPRPKKASIGEQAWWAATYPGIGYFLTLGVSVGVAQYFLNGRGKPLLEYASKGLEKQFSSLGMKQQTANTLAQGLTQYTVFPLGGHLCMLPIQFSEDHARYLTHESNKRLDKNYAYKDLSFSIHTHEDKLPKMANEPTDQSWRQIAARRGMAWATCITAGMLLGARRKAQLEKGTIDFIEKAVTSTGSETLKNISQTKLYHDLVKITALDAYFTVATSGVVAATKSAFGKKKNGDHLEVAEASLPSAPSEAPARSFAAAVPKRDISPASMPVPREKLADGVMAARAQAREAQYSLAP